MPKFKQWLTTRLNRQGEAPEAPPPPPYRTESDWPSIRPTPGNYGLFGRLPPELRQQVLGEAFGNRTLHVDLTFDHPLVRRPSSRINKWRKPGPDARVHCGFGTQLVRDASRPKRWQWFGCVCHRRLVRPVEEGCYVNKERIQPCQDECVPGKRIGGKPHARPDSLVLCDSDCFVRVMGWLLACRQAYLDGMDVLYRTNTFHIASLPLLLDLTRLMSPRALGAMTSLELQWPFFEPNLFRDKNVEDVWDSAAQAQTSTERPEPSTAFHRLCRMVPTAFPNVRRLHIALEAYIAPPHTWQTDNVLRDVDTVILGPIEDMFRQLNPTEEKDFSLAIQRGACFALPYCLPDRCAGIFHQGFEDGSYQPLAWKPLDEDGAGYTLRTGWDDLPLYSMFDPWRRGDGFWG